MQQCTSDQEAFEARIDKLVELDEVRRVAFDKMVIEQEKVKGTFDQRTRNVKFGIGDIILLWDKLKEKHGKHGKLEKYGWLLIEYLA